MTAICQHIPYPYYRKERMAVPQRPSPPPVGARSCSRPRPEGGQRGLSFDQDWFAPGCIQAGENKKLLDLAGEVAK